MNTINKMNYKKYFEDIFNEYKKNIEFYLKNTEELTHCISIFNILVNSNLSNIEHLTYNDIAKIAGCEIKNPSAVIKAIHFLTGNNAYLLDLCIEFLDDDMKMPIQIELKTYSNALNNGEFLHPINKKPILDFNKFLYPYFVPSQRLVQFNEFCK